MTVVHPADFQRASSHVRIGLIVAAFFLASISAFPSITAGQTEDESSLAGFYAVSIGERDVPLSLIGSAALEGSWVLRFGDDGRYSIERQDVGELVAGSFEVDGERVTVTDERGLLSCANTQPLGESYPTATYSWRKSGDLLRLEALDEECATREVLFSTRPLVPYVVCQTVPLDLSDAAAESEREDEDTELGSGLEGLRLGEDDEATQPSATPSSGVNEPASQRAIGVAEDPEQAIEDLISQLNACWATGDPARVLPLFSESFLDSATGGGAASIEDVAADIRQLQTTPVIWELAGDIEVDGDEAEAVVAATISGEEMLQTFRFVREDEGWRLDNLGE